MEYEESDIVELKSVLVDEVKQEIVSFLNADGGTIYIGVSDDKKVIGIQDADKDQLDLKVGGWITQAFFPSVSLWVHCHFNEDKVYVIYIKSGENKPYYLRDKGPKPSGCYIRVGRSKRQMSEWEIQSMVRDYHGYYFEKAISENQNLTFNQFALLCQTKSLSFEERRYMTLGIQEPAGRFTNLGLILSDQSPIEIKFAVYDKDLNFKVKKEYSGCLALIANTVVEYAD